MYIYFVKNNPMKKILFLLSFLLSIVNTTWSQNYEVCQNSPHNKQWTIVWGGKPSSKYGSKFMEKQAEYYLYNENVLYADYQLSIQFCESLIKGFCKEYKIVAVYGFSRGGVNAWQQIGKVDFIGLIDPLIPKNYNLNFDVTKVFMLYNSAVWDKDNKTRLEKTAAYLSNKNCRRLYMPHLDIPKLFFEKYKRGYSK